MMKQYKAKNGMMQWKQSLDVLLNETESDSDSGFCLACGQQAFGIEPDARKYTCDACGAHKVYGCQELLLMGLYYSTQGIPDNRTSHEYGDPRTQVAE
jgi:predicted RNA-binding Zn-ribbon protein involved in translation (DUF1610 family)